MSKGVLDKDKKDSWKIITDSTGCSYVWGGHQKNPICIHDDNWGSHCNKTRCPLKVKETKDNA